MEQKQKLQEFINKNLGTSCSFFVETGRTAANRGGDRRRNIAMAGHILKDQTYMSSRAETDKDVKS